MKRNRWLIALAAAGIHICIGSVYAWSVLTKPVMAEMGLSLSETTWAFSIAILFLGLSAGFLGGIVERLGPRKSGLVSACFFASAMAGPAIRAANPNPIIARPVAKPRCRGNHFTSVDTGVIYPVPSPIPPIHP